METIPEDINDEFLHSSQHQLDTACVLREIYRSEKLERHERFESSEDISGSVTA